MVFSIRKRARRPCFRSALTDERRGMAFDQSTNEHIPMGDRGIEFGEAADEVQAELLLEILTLGFAEFMLADQLSGFLPDDTGGKAV